MDGPRMALLIFLTLFLSFFSGVAAGNKDSVVVNIAAAYNSQIDDGWARYIFWQQLDGKIVIKSRVVPDEQPQEIPRATLPQNESPLAALYYPNSQQGRNTVFVDYLDEDGQIIEVACTYQNGKYTNWATTPTGHISASGLALARVDGNIRRFYIDNEGFVVQVLNGNATQLGPKAAHGSRISAAVPVGSSDIHIFFVSESLSLASLTFNGSGWSKVLPDIPEFTSKPDIGFSAVAWSNPLIIRMFYINQVANEWKFEGLSWANTTDTLLKAPGAISGQPVAASRSVNGSGRYEEYFYTTAKGQINYLAKTSINGPSFEVDFATFELPPPKAPLARNDVIAIVFGVIAAVLAVLGLVLTIYLYKKKKNKKHEDEGRDEGDGDDDEGGEGEGRDGDGDGDEADEDGGRDEDGDEGDEAIAAEPR